ncbi:MAG: hypothetical protein ACQCN3_14335 [Candidatus Bathyarchaeia archaeon]|jgi:hypothetical protein
MTYSTENKSNLSLNRTLKPESYNLSELSELLRLFKTECQTKGWQASETEEWVKADDGYHALFCTRPSVNIYSLMKIAERSKCLVIEGGSYRVADAAYTAWLLPEISEHMQKELVQAIAKNLQLAKKTALYFFHKSNAEALECLPVNGTDSKVFRQFEEFLKDKMGINLKQFSARKVPKERQQMLENTIRESEIAWG